MPPPELAGDAPGADLRASSRGRPASTAPGRSAPRRARPPRSPAAPARPCGRTTAARSAARSARPSGARRGPSGRRAPRRAAGPRSRSAATTASCASAAVSPANLSPASSVIRPSSPITPISSSPWRAADLEVVGVVAGGDLQRPGAELGVDVLVGDDRQAAADQRQHAVLPDQVAVALVVRVDGDRGVGQHRLRAHRRHGQHPVDALDRVVDRVEGVRRPRGSRPRGRRSPSATGVPVDHVVIAVDVALLEEGDEDAVDSGDVALVEGEALALVVAGGAEALVLLDDPRAVLLLPVPDPLLECLSAELVVAIGPLRRAAPSRPRPAWRCRRGRCPASRACCARASGASAPARPASSRSARGPCAARRSRSEAESLPSSSPPGCPRPAGWKYATLPSIPRRPEARPPQGPSACVSSSLLRFF